LKKISLGQTISIFANLGVIAGIVFLGVELQQNNQALEIQARSGREDLFRQAITRRYQIPEMLSASVKFRRGDALSDEEALILDWENHAVFVDWMLIYMQVHDGILDEETIPISLWRDGFNEAFPLMPESWSARKQTYRPDFVEYMEENVVNR